MAKFFKKLRLPSFDDPKAIVPMGLIALGVVVLLATAGGWLLRIAFAVVAIGAIVVGVRLLFGLPPMLSRRTKAKIAEKTGIFEESKYEEAEHEEAEVAEKAK